MKTLYFKKHLSIFSASVIFILSTDIALAERHVTVATIGNVPEEIKSENDGMIKEFAIERLDDYLNRAREFRRSDGNLK